MAKMITVRNLKLHELTVEISPGAFRTIPQGCEGEVPSDAPVVVEALKLKMIERKDSRVQGSEGPSEAPPTHPEKEMTPKKKASKKKTARKKK